MRKIQKLISGILCLSLLFLTAATAFAAAPYALIQKCPECMFGNVSISRRTVYEDPRNEPHECHDDIVQDYTVYNDAACDSCNYHVHREEIGTKTVLCLFA